MLLRNINTGKPEEVAIDDVARAFASGIYKPLDGARVLISPSGEAGIMPKESLQDALATGYHVPTQAELDAFAVKAEHAKAMSAFQPYHFIAFFGVMLASWRLWRRYGRSKPKA